MSIESTLSEKHIINATHLNGNELQLKPGINMGRLVGMPHIFGRYIETRNGFLIDPIGILTMQQDGRITGYHHSNEGSWIPYDHGTVSSDKGFAFINEHNTWIPSSTWQQTLGDIPIGHFCNESEGIKKLCLIPCTAAPKKVKVIYLVATCLKYYNDGRTIQRLLQQLDEEGIEKKCIRVVVNGSKQNANEEINEVSYAFSTHNAWEWSALYEAPLRWKDFDYAMLIHDTNDILPGFRRSVEEFNNHLNWDYLPATPNAACLLGLYSFNFLEELNSWLKSIDHIDKRNGVIAEVAGELLLRAKKALVMGDQKRFGGSRYAEWGPHVDRYNTGSPRHTRYFHSINLIKYIHSGGQPSNAKEL